MAVVAGEATSDRGCLPPLLDLDQPPASSRRAASARDADAAVWAPLPRAVRRGRARTSSSSKLGVAISARSGCFASEVWEDGGGVR
uniref:Uncharacterized protein n=1 Tax=Oryza nivara TaxID=4536 RepID=A0A0E0HFR1_ORYNI